MVLNNSGKNLFLKNDKILKRDKVLKKKPFASSVVLTFNLDLVLSVDKFVTPPPLSNDIISERPLID